VAASLVSLRLDDKTIRSLQRLARQKGVTRSDIVRNAVAKLLANEVALGEDSPQKVWARVIGSVHGVKHRDLSKRTDEKFRELLEERMRKRR
jgi:metal-responsive CopG/Arc/MetJ family transcriptional regulator